MVTGRKKRSKKHKDGNLIFHCALDLLSMTENKKNGSSCGKDKHRFYLISEFLFYSTATVGRIRIVFFRFFYTLLNPLSIWTKQEMNSNPFIKIHAIRLAIIYPDADLGSI